MIQVATTMTKVHAHTSNLITQTLSNGESFSLRASPIVPWYTTAIKTCVGIAALPLLLPVGAIWLASMSIPRIGDYILSLLVPRMMCSVDKEFRQERKTLLRKVTGKVLDVGSGGGAYLQYCQQADAVVAVEPNRSMHPAIRQAGKTLKQLTIVTDIDDVPSDSSPAASFDWIIFGNVLCEVPHVRSTISQVDSLLKPGGTIYFSEHIGCPRGTWQRTVQNWINPLWRHAGGGCNCNHDSLEELQKMLSYDIIVWTYEHWRVCLGPFVLGLALKEK